MPIDKTKILISIEEEQAIKNNDPTNIPLDPTAQGWSGDQVRAQFAASITGDEGSVLSELKEKTTLIKEKFDETDVSISSLQSGTVDLSTNKADKSYVDSQDATLETYIDLLEGRADSLETFQTVTVPATYETISNVDLVKDRVEDLETFQEVTVPATYETKADATSKLANKVDKTTKVIGINLQDDILLTEFKTALGNATQSVAGLLSAEDKTHLDGLVALLESSDGNTVVDTIGEILAIFNNYPEGADLVTALNGKVDKVAGKGLSQNDFTDALKNKLDGLLNGSQYYDKTYIDALKDHNGWKSQLLTPTPLAPSGTIATATLLLYNTLKLQVKNTATSFVDTDSVEVSLGVVTGNKIQLSDTSVYLEIGETNSTFVAPTGWQLQIVGLKYTELKAIDTTYDNVVSEMTATTVQAAIDEIDLTIEQKTDKLESRQVGTTQMSFVNGKLTSVVSDNVSTYLAYDTNGNIQKITETYADGKTYETTYTKDVEGRIKTMTKAEV